MVLAVAEACWHLVLLPIDDVYPLPVEVATMSRLRKSDAQNMVSESNWHFLTGWPREDSTVVDWPLLGVHALLPVIDPSSSCECQ
jgi:hypothetical protein